MPRMAKLDRVLTLVNALNEPGEGLTLDEMATAIHADRRTAERLRDVIRLHFDLDEETGADRRKRFRIRDSLRRHYTRPNAAELGALQVAADEARRIGSAQVPALDSLLAKIAASFDTRERSRLEPDLDALVGLQRVFVPAGPAIAHDPAALVQVQSAIMAGQCLEFDYLRDGAETPAWRRIVVVGLIHGPVTYVIGQIPDRPMEPAPYRLDRMRDVRLGNEVGVPAEDWDLDAWMAKGFGIWREDGHDIVLRGDADAAPRARAWRFHPDQVLEDDGEELLIRFHSGGLREIADHLFSWGGTISIEAPEKLREVMRERLDDGWWALGEGGDEEEEE